MNDDRAAATRGGAATIQLWQTPSRVWPAFPTLALVRAVSRLRRNFAGQGVTVFVDDEEVGGISPKQIKVYQVSPGEHSLSVQILGGLRRSKKLHVSLGRDEEQQFVCLLNGMGWPVVRPATPKDVATMKRW
jgi:hypothetical protein